MEREFEAKFIYKPPNDGLSSEFGSSIPVRFLTESKTILNESQQTVCIDCDAKSLAFQLEEINLDNAEQDLVLAMKKMHEALLFILWNVDWPVGD